MMANDLPKRVHQNRPSLILNIDNEYMTYLLMDEIKGKSIRSNINSVLQTQQCEHASTTLLQPIRQGHAQLH
jgi:hypothetical protein